MSTYTGAFLRTGETSREAAASLDRVSLRANILILLCRLGAHGATCDEIEERTGMKHQTVGPRLLELRKLGLVVADVKDGRAVTRKTRSGRPAVVWIAAEFA